MDSFAQIIEQFGGSASFAKAIGIPDSHARAMKARDSIPDGYWSRIVDAAAENNVEGVSFKLLADLAEAKLQENARLKTANEEIIGGDA